MDLLNSEISKYIENHSSDETEVLKELDRETHLKVMMPRMLSGKVQGRLLSFISKMIRPSRILEIGTYTGYATICLAEGLLKEGQIITLDKNPEIEDLARSYFKKAGIHEKVNFKVGDALSLLDELSGEFDLIFIDADKANYSNYYKKCLPKLSDRGLMIADNVLWSGKVVDVKEDKNTKAIKDFNELVQKDERVENVVLSVRDGLMLIRKK